MRKMNMIVKKFKRRHNVFLLCLFALALLCVLPAGKAFAAADPAHDTYKIENSNISSVSLQYKDWKGDWHTVTPSNNHTFSQWEEIGFFISYNIPAGDMAELSDNATITYQVQGITEENKLISSNGQQPLYTSESAIPVQVGTYEISETGLITIRLTDYVAADGTTQNQIKQNKSGASAIREKVRFTAKVSDLKKGEGSSTELKIGDFTIKVPLQENQSQGSNLSVNKSAGAINEKGELTYTIDVYSNNGTKEDEPVTITDTMTGGTVLINKASDVTVKDSNKADVNISNLTVNSEKKQFSFNLPAMAANSHYYITYTGKIDAPTEGAATVSNVDNKVKAESKDDDGNTLEDEHTVTTQINPISKSGSYNGNNDTITWTIKINSLGRNLNGYKIDDVFYGRKIDNVTMTDSFGKSQTISLPYTFDKDTTSNYTLTYTTEALRDVGSYNSVNTATLTPEGSETPYNAEASTGTWGAYTPLSKTAESVRPASSYSEHNLVNIKWTVTLNTDKGDIRPGENGAWTYTDTLQDGQYIKFALIGSNTKENFENGIISAFGQYWNKDTDTIDLNYTGDTITGFTITCHSVIPKGTKISFGYTATAPLPDGQKATYTNQGDINTGQGKQAVYEPATYNPLISKFDARKVGEGTKDTTHDYYDKDLSDDGTSTGSGILKWGIELTVPEENNADITLTEKLPAGVTLYESERVPALTMMDGNNVTDTFKGFTTDSDHHVNDESTATVTFQGETITATYNQTARTVTWTIPVALARKYQDQQNRRLDYYIAVQVDPDTIASSDTGYNSREFKNTVNVSIDGEDSGSATHTQIISKDDRHDAVSKTCNQNKDANALEYTLDINPNGKKYLKNSETLTIQDVLTYGTNNRDAVLSLVPETVALYKVNGNTETKIENFTYSYNHQSEKNYYSDYYNHTSTIEATVPDGEHLRLKYTYKANGDEGVLFSDISNTATLKGIVTTNEAKTNQSTYEINNNAATSDTSLARIFIYKHDADDFNKKLSNAVFKLEKYDKDTGDYTELVTYPTDANGQLVFPKANDPNTNLTFNQAYRLTEITAPNGYRKNSTPYYFYIKNSNTDLYPTDNMPEDFQGTGYYNNGTIYRPNHTMSGTTSLNIQKRWVDKDGNQTDPPADATATFAIHQVERPFAANAKFILQNRDRTADLDKSFDKLTSGGYADGTKLNITITYNNDWSTDGADLSAYEEDGTRLNFNKNHDGGKTTYTLTDYVVDGDMNWKMVLDADPANLKAEVTVSQEGHTRFDDVYQQGVTVDKAHNWQTTVDNLPLYGQKYIGGILTDVAYAYYVEETAGPDGYLVYYSDDKQGVTEGKIVVTNRENLTDLELKKVWQDENGHSITGSLPEDAKAVFHLYRTGYSTEAGKMTLNVKNTNGNLSDLSYDSKDLVLDGYPQGTKINYELSYVYHDWENVSPEIKDDSGATITGDTKELENGQRKYTFSTVVGSGNNANSSYTLTLDNVPAGTTLKRTSIELPEPVERKTAFPNARRNRIELSKANNWTLRVAGATDQLGALPKSKTEMVNGEPVTTYYYYQVVESEVNGYTTTYSANNEIGVQNGTITATNTENKTNISVKKEWQDASGNKQTTDTPGEVKFDLYRRVSTEPVTATLDSSIPNNTKTISYPEGTVLRYRLTYKYEWSEPTVTLSQDSSEYIQIDRTGKTSTNNTYFDLTSTVHKDAKYILNLSDNTKENWDFKLYSIELPKLNDIEDELIGTYETNGGTWTSDSLTKTGQITVKDEKVTGYYYYYVKEHPVDGYAPSYANNEGINEGTINITNKKLDNTVLNVRKDWQKEDGSPDLPPENTPSIKFKLIQKATKISSSEAITVNTQTNMNYGNFTLDNIGIPSAHGYVKNISLHYKITYTKDADWKPDPPNLTVSVNEVEKPISTNTAGSKTVYEFDTGTLDQNTTIIISDSRTNVWYDQGSFKGEVTAAEGSGSIDADTTTETIEKGTYEISAANDWEWYSSNVPELANLQASEMVEENIGGENVNVPVTYQYYIQEIDPPAGYETLYHVGTNAETRGESNAIPLGNTGTIINRINSTSITANKIWNGVSGGDLASQPDAYVTLHRALKANVGGNIIVGSEAQVGEQVNLKDYKDDTKHPWSYTWTALPKSGTYNGVAGTWLYWVEEEAVDNHTTAYRYVLPLDESITGDAEKTTAYQSDTFTKPGADHGINGGTFVIMNMKKTAIAVKKAWQNGNGETINPTDKQATVTLKRREKTYTAPTKSSESNPPAINVRMMTRDGNLQEIYHISDDKVIGSPDGDGNFAAKITVTEPDTLTEKAKYAFWYKFKNQNELSLANYTAQLTPQNSYKVTINLTIPKELLKENCINVDMMFQSYDHLEKTVIYSGETAIDKVTADWNYGPEEIVGSAVLNANQDPAWTYQWNDLPTGNEKAFAGTESTYEYWVEETPIAGYQATYSGKTIDGKFDVALITSDHDSKTIAPQGTMTVITNKEVASTISLKKVWKDAEGNTTDSHPDEVQVNVYREMIDADGKVITRKDGSNNDITKETVNYLFREATESESNDYNDPLTLNRTNDFKLDSIQVPPITGEYEGKNYSYQYTAKEVAIEGYDSNVTYDKQVAMGDNDLPTAFNEAITVTNTPKSNKFIFPSTGSMGLWIMMAIGLGLMGYGAWRYQKSSGKPDKPNGENTDESG